MPVDWFEAERKPEKDTPATAGTTAELLKLDQGNLLSLTASQGGGFMANESPVAPMTSIHAASQQHQILLQSTESDSMQIRDSSRPDSMELLAELRNRMPDLSEAEETWMKQPEILEIYLQARSSLTERADIMETALKWRVENRTLLSTLTCPCCAENAWSHDARCFGTDPEGDIVFMNCFALPRNLNPTGVAEHMTCLFERALQRFPKAKKWTWIIDMHGFGVGNMDPRTSIKLLHLLQVAYRGRLKRCIVLNAPFGWGVLWSSIQPFIQEKTASLIQFHVYPKISSDLQQLVGCDLANKLLAEMEENRDYSRARLKSWTTFWAT